MEEISIILKSNLLVTVEEFRILDRYSCQGKFWTLVNRPGHYITTERTIEYIFDPESLTMFGIISSNILVTWNTEITRNMGPNDEFQLMDSLFIRPYYNSYL